MMEQENNPAPGEDRMTDAKASVGRRLRERREYLEMSVDDVVSKIKLAHRQITALEADDFQALPETAFLRGFVRSYAKLLQMEVQPLLDALPGDQLLPVKVEPPHVEAPFSTTARRKNVNLLLAALFITLCIAGFAIWQTREHHAEPSQSAQSAQSAQQSGGVLVATPLPLNEPAEITGSSAVLPQVPTPAIPVPVQAASSAGQANTSSEAALRFVFGKESWAEIKDQTGVTLSRQVNPAGSELRVVGVPPFTLVIGHAAAVHLYYREKAVDLSSYINAGSDVARMKLE